MNAKDMLNGNIDYDTKVHVMGFMDEYHDPVENPKHYTRGKIEVLDFIEDQGLDYHKGNAVKYICRAGYKDGCSELQDIEKAITYLRRKAELLRK